MASAVRGGGVAERGVGGGGRAGAGVDDVTGVQLPAVGDVGGLCSGKGRSRLHARPHGDLLVSIGHDHRSTRSASTCW